MKIAIIGGGPSGIIAALEIKKKYKEAEVIIYEQKEALGKKIKASGNGRCNIGNLAQQFSSYKNDKVVERLLKDYDQEEYLKSLGILTKVMYDGYLYPVSESAHNVVEILLSQLEDIDVKIQLKKTLINYQAHHDGVYLSFKDEEVFVNKVIFATGGKSSPQLGSDGSLFSLFQEKGYLIETLKPGLTPIRVKENINNLSGTRLKALVTLEEDGKILHEEKGEVQFKKDGLSGLVIMNISSLITRKQCKSPIMNIYLLKNDGNLLDLETFLKTSLKINKPLLTYVNEKLANYFYDLANLKTNKHLSEKQLTQLFKVFTPLKFNYLNHYDFQFSQVTLGGISFVNLNDDLSSKHEPNIYFVGEVLDVDGPCGGYNLRFAIGSSLHLVKLFKL